MCSWQIKIKKDIFYNSGNMGLCEKNDIVIHTKLQNHSYNGIRIRKLGPGCYKVVTKMAPLGTTEQELPYEPNFVLLT